MKHAKRATQIPNLKNQQLVVRITHGTNFGRSLTLPDRNHSYHRGSRYPQELRPIVFGDPNSVEKCQQLTKRVRKTNTCTQQNRQSQPMGLQCGKEFAPLVPSLPSAGQLLCYTCQITTGEIFARGRRTEGALMGRLCVTVTVRWPHTVVRWPYLEQRYGVARRFAGFPAKALRRHLADSSARSLDLKAGEAAGLLRQLDR